MTLTRVVSTTVVAFLVSQIIAIAIHGYILAGDYAPFEGTLLRSTAGENPPWQMLFLPVAHLFFVSALVWVYARLRLQGSSAFRGIALGVVGWSMGQVPLWLVWYAQQPWPGAIVLKQLGLELLSSVLVGLTIATVAGWRHPVKTRSLA